MYSVAKCRGVSIVICLVLESNGALRVMPPALFRDNIIIGFAGVILSLVRKSALTPDRLENPVHPLYLEPLLTLSSLLGSWPLRCSVGERYFVLVKFGGG
jgi:hypothetical protein